MEKSISSSLFVCSFNKVPLLQLNVSFLFCIFLHIHLTLLLLLLLHHHHLSVCFYFLCISSIFLCMDCTQSFNVDLIVVVDVCAFECTHFKEINTAFSGVDHPSCSNLNSIGIFSLQPKFFKDLNFLNLFKKNLKILHKIHKFLE